MIEQHVMEMMLKMDTLDERSRMSLLSNVDEQRNKLLGILLKHLGTSSSGNVQTAAIYLIGRHRISEGIDELIRHIDFVSARQQLKGPRPLWAQYPAMEALITIGKPSVKPIIELLSNETNTIRRDLGVKVIRYIEGSDTAQFILEKTMAVENDPVRKNRLQEALVRLTKLPQ